MEAFSVARATLSSFICGYSLRSIYLTSRGFSAGYKQQLALCSFNRVELIDMLASIVFENGSSCLFDCVLYASMFFFHRLIARIEAKNDLVQKIVALIERFPSYEEGHTRTIGERVEQDEHELVLCERKFPRLSEDDNRSLGQRIDEAYVQSRRSRMRKVIDDTTLVIYLHIPEITLLANIVFSAMLLYSGINVVGNMITLLFLLWTVGEQGLFFGFHPRENSGLVYDQLNKVIEIFSPIYNRLSRMIELLSPISLIVSKCQFCMLLLFELRYSGPITKAMALSKGSYVVVNYLFPRFFDAPKFYRVVLQEDLSAEVFPSQDHFRPVVWEDLYEEGDLQEMLCRLRERLPEFLNHFGETTDTNAGSVISWLFQEEMFKNLIGESLKKTELKLIVGTILEDPKKLGLLLTQHMIDTLQNTCLKRQASELRWIFQEWYDEKMNRVISESGSFSALQNKLRRQFLFVSQQMRNELALQVRSSAISVTFPSHGVFSTVKDYLTTNYYFYMMWQMVYGKYLGMSDAQIVEDQMKRSNYNGFCLLKWFIKLNIWWKEGKLFMRRYFEEWKSNLLKAICDVSDRRIALADVWAYLSHSNRKNGCQFRKEYLELDERLGGTVNDTQFLADHMQELLLDMELLKTREELDASVEGEAPVLVL